MQTIEDRPSARKQSPKGRLPQEAEASEKIEY
jgi:hypothetical protein